MFFQCSVNCRTGDTAGERRGRQKAEGEVKKEQGQEGNQEIEIKAAKHLITSK